ncbi:hypothetical protein IFR05_001932 [Cadophora sp. M221]|nr:hypothetical protein IFR05_001932 [Cadophora sp. M221]
MATRNPPRPEDIDRWHRHTTLENFGRALNKRAKLVFSSESRSRYSNVHVLVIKWEREDPNLPVSHEIEDLCRVLKGTYHYQTEIFEIPDKKSHARVSAKINAFIDINDDSKDDLKIIYYAGHGKLTKTKDLIWFSPLNRATEQYSTVTWTGIQKSLEQADSDVLILLDCCSGGVSNVGEGNGVTTVISACAYDAEANGVGHYSFTKALTIELGLMSLRSFSTGELHQNVYARTQHHMAQGIQNEQYPAPIHIELTRERGFPRSIHLSVHRPFRVSNRRVSNPLPATSLSSDWMSTEQLSSSTNGNIARRNSSEAPQVFGHDGDSAEPPVSMSSSTANASDEGASAYLSNESDFDIFSSQSSLEPECADSPWPSDAPRIMVGIRLEDSVRPEDLSTDYFEDWLRALPAPVREVRVEAGFSPGSSLVMLSLPASVGPYLPQNLATDPSNGETLGCNVRAATPVPKTKPTTRAQLPEPFEKPEERLVSYPINLAFPQCYSATVKAQKKSLEMLTPKALSNYTSQVEFLEIGDFGSSSGIKKGVINDEHSLKLWLGDTDSECFVCMRDPVCRFISVASNHLGARLPITKQMLLRILTYHQVMPPYPELLSGFGVRDDIQSATFTPFLQQTNLPISTQDPAVRALRRSGRRYQLSYNLNGCCRNPLPVPIKKWKISQAVIHHQFDVEEGTSLWILAHDSSSVKEKLLGVASKNGIIANQIPSSPVENFGNGLSVHLLYCQWSIEDWRCYLVELARAVKEAASTFEKIGKNGEFIYTHRHVEILQGYLDKIHYAKIALEANRETITSLRDFYSNLKNNEHFDLRHECEVALGGFESRLNDFLCDLEVQVTRANNVIRTALEKQIMIAQYLHLYERVELTTATMQSIELATQKESLSMQIILIVTLIFLPATFVSTIFGLDIMKWEGHDSLHRDAIYLWTQMAVGLAALTILVRWSAFIRTRSRVEEKTKRGVLPLYKDPEIGSEQVSKNEKKRL